MTESDSVPGFLLDWAHSSGPDQVLREALTEEVFTSAGGTGGGEKEVVPAEPVPHNVPAHSH